jgi:hypothetical protein
MTRAVARSFVMASSTLGNFGACESGRRGLEYPEQLRGRRAGCLCLVDHERVDFVHELTTLSKRLRAHPLCRPKLPGGSQVGVLRIMRTPPDSIRKGRRESSTDPDRLANPIAKLLLSAPLRLNRVCAAAPSSHHVATCPKSRPASIVATGDENHCHFESNTPIAYLRRCCQVGSRVRCRVHSGSEVVDWPRLSAVS